MTSCVDTLKMSHRFPKYVSKDSTSRLKYYQDVLINSPRCPNEIINVPKNVQHFLTNCPYIVPGDPQGVMLSSSWPKFVLKLC